MKLSILYESRNPKQPTDLSLVATQSTKDGAARGKYPVNFYSGKIGYKSSGKVVLGYHDKEDKFRTTGPIVGIVQSKKAPDRWLIKTINDSRPAYYSIQMPEATVMSTYNRYLTLNQSTPIPIYTYDQNTKKHINKKDTRRRDNEGWSYFNGTTINKSNMPTRKPKTSVEAYDYLMYWAYHNHRRHSTAATSDYHDLIAILLNEKRLSKGIRDIVAAFPNARSAVIKRLKYIETEEDKEFELNLDVDEPATAEEPEATPVPASAPESTPEPAPKPEQEPREPNQSGSDADRLQAELTDLEQEIEAEVARLTASLQAEDPESTLSDRSVADHDRLQTELSDLEQEIARLTVSLEGDPASANTVNIIKELEKCLTKLTALRAEADAVQDTTAEESSALDQDTHQGQASDSGSVEMPSSEIQRADPEETQASPEVKKANSDKFIMLMKQLFSLDPIEKPKRTLKAATEFMGFLGMPALWGKCYEGGPGQWLDGYIEDYARMCKVKAFWAGDSRRDVNRRDAEWPNMTKNDKSFMLYHRDTIDQKVTAAKSSFTSELAKHITKIRTLYPSLSQALP